MSLTVKVVLQDTGESCGPVLYEIKHMRNERTWSVRQRYRTLHAMTEALRSEEAELPSETFPPKRWYFPLFQAMPTNELEDRRRGLQSYLVALSELKDSWSSPAVTSVLCVEDDKPGEADGNGDTSTVEALEEVNQAGVKAEALAEPGPAAEHLTAQPQVGHLDAQMTKPRATQVETGTSQMESAEAEEAAGPVVGSAPKEPSVEDDAVADVVPAADASVGVSEKGAQKKDALKDAAVAATSTVISPAQITPASEVTPAGNGAGDLSKLDGDTEEELARQSRRKSLLSRAKRSIRRSVDDVLHPRSPLSPEGADPSARQRRSSSAASASASAFSLRGKVKGIRDRLSVGTTPKLSATTKGKSFFSLSSSTPTTRASGDGDGAHDEQLHSPGHADASPGANTASAAPASPAGEGYLTPPRSDVQAGAGVPSGAAAVPRNGNIDHIDDVISPSVNRRLSVAIATGAHAPPSPDV